MLRLLSFVLFASITCCAFASAGSPSVEISGASRDKVRNEIVRQLTKNGEYLLVEETYFRLVFVKDVENSENKVYQTTVPKNKYIFAVADVDHGVQVSAAVQLIENVGSSFERQTTIKTGAPAETSQAILVSLKNSLAGPVDSPIPASAPSSSQAPRPAQEEGLRHRSVSVATRNAAAGGSPRIGFAASASFDKEAQGLVITAVDPRTPAAKAGLQPADIVLAIDGQPIATSEQMENARSQLMKRRQGKLKVFRDGKTYDATLRF